MDAVEHEQWTPLHVASRYGHEAVAKLLLERGAALGAVGHVLWTPLHVASYCGHDAVARLLIERGATMDAGAPLQPLKGAST